MAVSRAGFPETIMAQPTPYTREFNFSNQQAATPSTPIPATHLDAEFNRVKLTTDQIRANLALIQQDDGTIDGGALGAATVGYAQLDPEIVGDLIAAGATEGAFAAAFTDFETDAPLATEWSHLRGLTAGGTSVRIPVDSSTAQYRTEAVFAASNIPAAVMAIRTAGYYEAGDGGGHLKVRIATPSPAKAWHKQSADGAWWEIKATEISPLFFGAYGDGVEDDGVALNDVGDYIRYLLTQSPATSFLAINVYLTGGYYKTTISVDWTGIQSWNLVFHGGVILGHCTGKCVVDVVGWRGPRFDGLAIWGDETNRPSRAIQMARPTASGYCGSWKMDHVMIDGYFSNTAFYGYGFEGVLMDHIQVFNRDPAGRAAIFEGFDEHPVTSDYTTVMTGDTSFILNKIVASNFRYLPISGKTLATVTGVTKANPGVVTCSGGHPFVNGKTLCFSGVGGMTELNSVVNTIGNCTATTFELTGLDTSAFTTFTSGGSAIERCAAPPVYLGRAEQFNFDNAYIVSYGQPHLELGFHSSSFTRMEQIDLDILFEGSGNSHNIIFATDGNACSIYGFRLKTYNSRAHDSFLSVEGGGTLKLYHPYIECVDPVYANRDMFDVPASVSMYGADLLYPNLVDVEYSSMAAFNGKITDITTELTTIVKGLVLGTTNPTMTPGTGTITTPGTRTLNYVIEDKRVDVDVNLTITTNGTGATNIAIPAPVAAASGRTFFLYGRSSGSGSMLVGTVSGSTITIRTYNNAYPGGDGYNMLLSGFYYTD